MILVLLSLTAYADDPLAAAVGSMTSTANAYYPTGSPVNEAGPARLRPSTFTNRLGVVRDLLEAEGCTVSTETDNVAGAYRHRTADATLGEDANGEPIVATTTTSFQVSGTVGADPLGSTVGAWTNGGRFVIDRGDRFYVGEIGRVAGPRGVFMGLGVTCPGGTSPESALAGWFDGDLTGLDPADDFTLNGSWTVDLDCSDTDVWTITGGPLSHEIVGTDFSATADADPTPGTYSLTGTRTIDIPPFGVFELPVESGSITVTGPDAIGIEFIVTAPIIGPVSCVGSGSR